MAREDFEKNASAMPETQYSTYDKARLDSLAERFSQLAERYSRLASLVGERTCDLPNQATLDRALRDIRKHVSKAEVGIEELIDSERQEQLGESVAAKMKKSIDKKGGKSSKKPAS